jgi:hypothetical protein
MLAANTSVTLAVIWLLVGGLGLSVTPQEWRGILLSAVMLAGALVCLFAAT